MTACTIAGLLDECAASRPTRPLLRDVAGTTLTVAEVAALSSAAAGWLLDAGVRPGMTVAWQLPSDVNAAVVMLALARMPVVQAPVIHLYRLREVCAAVEVANADILLVDESTAANAAPGMRTVTVPNDFVEQLENATAATCPELDGPPSADGPALDVLHLRHHRPPEGRAPHGRHPARPRHAVISPHLGLGDHPEEVGTIAFPIAHVGGMVYLASALLGDFSGRCWCPKVYADELPRLLAEHRVTVTGASTAFYQMLLVGPDGRADSRIADALAADADRRRCCLPAGTAPTGAGTPADPDRARLRHDGGADDLRQRGHRHRRAADQQLRAARSPDPRCGSAPAVRSSCAARNLTPGIRRRTSSGSARSTPDGWFRTGDQGHLRPDGRIVVTGRTKDLIIRKGENIAPDEVENELLAHPLVDEVAVLGQPDELRGEMVCAVVRRSPRHRDVTLDELCAFLDERGLMKQKWPERLVVVDEFPLTGLGKVAQVRAGSPDRRRKPHDGVDG